MHGILIFFFPPIKIGQRSEKKMHANFLFQKDLFLNKSGGTWKIPVPFRKIIVLKMSLRNRLTLTRKQFRHYSQNYR